MKKILIVAFLLIISTTGANATLMGDTIQGSITDSYNVTHWSNPSAIVSAGIEFSAVLTNLTIMADFTSDSVTLSYLNTSSFPNITVQPLSFIFNDIDWMDVPSKIIGMTQISNDFPQPLFFSTLFGEDSIQIDIPLTNTNPGDRFSATFRIDRVPTSVPEPAAMLLFGAGLAGLGIVRKRFKG